MKRVAVACLFAAVLIAGCIGQADDGQLNGYKLKYAGQDITFRSNLHEASNVTINDANGAREMLFDLNVEKIYIAYVPSDRTFVSVTGNATYNGLYRVVGMELAGKLGAIWGVNFRQYAPVEAIDLNSTSEAASLATPQTPVILMDAGASSTEVYVGENMISLRGADLDEVGRDYTDLDLAADKLLLVLMGRG